MPEVLYLSYDGLTDPLGQSQVMPYILGLEKEGYSYHIISFEKHKNFEKDSNTIRELISGKKITWLPQNYRKRPPVISTLIDLRKMSKQASKVCEKTNISIVHARSYLPGLIALKLKNRFGINFLFDMRGFWANERVDGGLWNLKNPIYRAIYKYIKKKEVQLIDKAKHIISLTQAGKEEIISGRLFEYAHASVPTEKITVIPCAVDLELFDPKKVSEADIQKTRQRINVNEYQKVMVYLGSIGTWYMLDEMLQYFRLWNEKNPGYIFLFVTKDDSTKILSAAKKLDISKESIRIVSASRSEVPTFLKASDIGLFFIKPAYSKKASSATKMGEMIAMKLPFVTNKGVGDANQIIKQYECGELVDLEKMKVVSKTLESTRNTELVLNYFNLESGTANYLKVYQLYSINNA